MLEILMIVVMKSVELTTLCAIFKDTNIIIRTSDVLYFRFSFVLTFKKKAAASMNVTVYIVCLPVCSLWKI